MDLNRLIDFYQTLTPASLDRFPEFYSPDAYFKDPFNEVRGIEAITRIFRHMFHQVSAPRFVITERLQDPTGTVLVWEFCCHIQRWGQRQTLILRGVSHLKFDDQGRVNYHRDYWDAAEELYMKLPLLGSLMRCLKHAFAS